MMLPRLLRIVAGAIYCDREEEECLLKGKTGSGKGNLFAALAQN
jgi:hypothetical protein